LSNYNSLRDCNRYNAGTVETVIICMATPQPASASPSAFLNGAATQRD
jgi:hypothetical protein